MCGYFYLGFQSLKTPFSPQGGEYVYELRKGASFNSVLKDLAGVGFLEDSPIIKLYTRYTKYNSRLKAGTYKLTSAMSQLSILEELTKGKSIDEKITFQEGLNINDIAELIAKNSIASKKEALDLLRDKKLVKELTGLDLPSFEGYLFPETYFINKSTTLLGLVKKMVKNFEVNYQKSLEGAQLKLDKRTHIVLASMIEKETGAAEERPLISSVFHNRIKKNMKFQSDPTILYGMFDKTGVFPTNIRKKDILEKTRYNTYAIKGLPYGPIANPGLESLKAALNPVKSNKLYFVSRNDGTHVFSATLAEHERAVRKWQIEYFRKKRNK